MRLQSPGTRLPPLLALICVVSVLTGAADAQAPRQSSVFIKNVRVYDGINNHLSEPSRAPVVGNRITTISSATLQPPADTTVTRIQSGGHTLMPGLLDAHTRLLFATLPQVALITADFLFDAAVAATQGDQLAKMVRWYTVPEVLRMATSVNGEVLALAGLLLVDREPLQNLKLVAEPEKPFLLIMKVGKVYKTLVQ